MGKYLAIFRSVAQAGSVIEQPGRGYDINDKRHDAHERDNTFGRLSRFGRTLYQLEHRCPGHIETTDWQQAIEDARRFIPLWGQRAEALGWSCNDLFGLHHPPETPAASYRRLSRYDQTGLIWLLRGRPLVSLTATDAAYRCASGAILTHRRENKPSPKLLMDEPENARRAA